MKGEKSKCRECGKTFVKKIHNHTICSSKKCKLVSQMAYKLKKQKEYKKIRQYALCGL